MYFGSPSPNRSGREIANRGNPASQFLRHMEERSVTPTKNGLAKNTARSTTLQRKLQLQQPRTRDRLSSPPAIAPNNGYIDPKSMRTDLDVVGTRDSFEEQRPIHVAFESSPEQQESQELMHTLLREHKQTIEALQYDFNIREKQYRKSVHELMVSLREAENDCDKANSERDAYKRALNQKMGNLPMSERGASNPEIELMEAQEAIRQIKKLKDSSLERSITSRFDQAADAHFKAGLAMLADAQLTVLAEKIRLQSTTTTPAGSPERGFVGSVNGGGDSVDQLQKETSSVGTMTEEQMDHHSRVSSVTNSPQPAGGSGSGENSGTSTPINLLKKGAKMSPQLALMMAQGDGGGHENDNRIGGSPVDLHPSLSGPNSQQLTSESVRFFLDASKDECEEILETTRTKTAEACTSLEEIKETVRRIYFCLREDALSQIVPEIMIRAASPKGSLANIHVRADSNTSSSLGGTVNLDPEVAEQRLKDAGIIDLVLQQWNWGVITTLQNFIFNNLSSAQSGSEKIRVSSNGAFLNAPQEQLSFCLMKLQQVHQLARLCWSPTPGGMHGLDNNSFSVATSANVQSGVFSTSGSLRGEDQGLPHPVPRTNQGRSSSQEHLVPSGHHSHQHLKGSGYNTVTRGVKGFNPALLQSNSHQATQQQFLSVGGAAGHHQQHAHAQHHHGGNGALGVDPARMTLGGLGKKMKGAQVLKNAPMLAPDTGHRTLPKGTKQHSVRLKSGSTLSPANRSPATDSFQPLAQPQSPQLDENSIRFAAAQLQLTTNSDSMGTLTTGTLTNNGIVRTGSSRSFDVPPSPTHRPTTDPNFLALQQQYFAALANQHGGPQTGTGSGNFVDSEGDEEEEDEGEVLYDEDDFSFRGSRAAAIEMSLARAGSAPKRAVKAFRYNPSQEEDQEYALSQTTTVSNHDATFSGSMLMKPSPQGWATHSPQEFHQDQSGSF